MPGMSYYLTCFVIDAKTKRYLMGKKDGKRGLCKVLTGGNPNQVNLILRDLRKWAGLPRPLGMATVGAHADT